MRECKLLMIVDANNKYYNIKCDGCNAEMIVFLEHKIDRGLDLNLDKDTLEFIFNASDEEFESALNKLIDFKQGAVEVDEYVRHGNHPDNHWVAVEELPFEVGQRVRVLVMKEVE